MDMLYVLRDDTNQVCAVSDKPLSNEWERADMDDESLRLFLQLSFTTPIDIFLKPVVKGLIRYSGILFCHLFNTSSKA